MFDIKSNSYHSIPILFKNQLNYEFIDLKDVKRDHNMFITTKGVTNIWYLKIVEHFLSILRNKTFIYLKY